MSTRLTADQGPDAGGAPPASPPALPPGDRRGLPTRLRRVVGPVLVVLLLGGALWLLHRELRAYHYEDIRRFVAAVPGRQLALALALTVLSYLVLTEYDGLALRYIDHELPYRQRALASFLGYAFSHNAGLSWLGGAAPRYRLYSAWGLSTVEITRLVLFTSLTLWPGAFLITAVSLLGESRSFAASLRVPQAAAWPLAGVFLLVLAAYVAAGTFRRRPFFVRGWQVPLPSGPIALGQVALSTVDWMVASAVLYVLLPVPRPVPYLHFVGLYVIAGIGGIVSSVPAGLGVFDGIVLVTLGAHAGTTEVAGALLVYRVIYYLVPLVLATAALATQELARRSETRRLLSLFGRWAPGLAPSVLAVAVYVGGVILLFSGATPALEHRLAFLARLMPLPLLELSHFLGSLTGVGLLLLANGLQRRLDAAYHLAVVLLGLGAVFSLFKGFDYEEALLLTTMLGALVACRRSFYRRASLLSERFTPGWTVAVALAIVASIYLGVFAYRHVEYGRELWWQFELSGDVSRYLRASVGVVTLALFFAAARLLRPAPPPPVAPDREAMERARAIVAGSTRASAHLALLGDKNFLFSEDGRALIMYAVAGRSWVSMGDPVGPVGHHTDLVWRFRELCDLYDAWPVFYEAAPGHLHLYLDAGLQPIKFGETARVPLASFSLEGGARKEQRYVLRRLERDGSHFEVLAPEAVPAVLPALRAISDDWLAHKNTREKGFSLGSFVPDYVAHCPVAVVRKGEAIVAFANVWRSAEQEEVSVDLMRYRREAPASVMEYLFLQIILWARGEGVRWFNLGMAPLAGLGDHALAPLWHRLGAFAFRHGEHFYNFRGLRQFKEKFDPVWEPRYLVCPGGLVVPRVLANVAALVSGGLRGVLSK